MLSSEELTVLELIDELGRSSLNIADQKPQVLKIVQLICELEDEREEQRIIGKSTSDFVDLAKLRLENAEKESLANYDRSLDSKNKATEQLDQNNAEDKHLKSDAELATGMSYTNTEFGDGNGGDALREAVHESKSSEITEVLFRMHRMAREEVLKGEQNIDELDMSSKSLTTLTTKFNAVDLLLNGSKRLVRVLDEADKKDRRLMLASMAFLGAVLVYIIVRRILSGPLKLLLWTFFRLFGLAKWAAKLYKPKSPVAVEVEGAVSAVSAVSAATAAAATTIGTLTSLVAASVSTAANLNTPPPIYSGPIDPINGTVVESLKGSVNGSVNETVNGTVGESVSEVLSETTTEPTPSGDYVTDVHDADDVHETHEMHETHTESDDPAETESYHLPLEDMAADYVEAHDDL